MAEVPKDQLLRDLFSQIAADSDGDIDFKVSSLTDLARETRIQLSRSPNPLYTFVITDPATSEQRRFVGFTLSLDGSRRPATRVEALGKSLADSDGKLFDLNPFLMVFDYTGNRLLAVSAMELFGAFAKHASENRLPYSESSTFSLSPNFTHGTINMYAELRPPAVWQSSSASEDLDQSDLISFLDVVAAKTENNRDAIPSILAAIRARLTAGPAVTGAGAMPATMAMPATDLVELDPADDAVQIDDRLWQMIMTAIASTTGVILVGPPGTGKSALIRKAVAVINADRMARGFAGIRKPLWATPDESWTSRELIGGETVSEGEIAFRPGWVLRAISEGRWLVLDEANRGDLDKIFGALLTWLAGGTVAVGVESSAADARTIELGWTAGESQVEEVEGAGPGEPGKVRYLASQRDWKLLGTYNAIDSQRVFRIGAALGRRFVRVPIPPVTPETFERILTDQADDIGADLIAKLGLLYRAHYEAEVTRVGPALFIGACSYIRAALVRRPDHDVAPNEPTESGISATADVSRTSVPRSDDTILTEAYVLHLGTLLAQLEEPDFDQLMHRVGTTAALNPEGIEWMSNMIRALA